MKAYRYLTILVMSLVVIGISIQPVSAIFSISRFDSTGYNHVIEGTAARFSNIDVDSSTGVMEAYGSSAPFDLPSSLVLELGFAFDAPEDGDFQVAIVWSSSYCLTIWKFWWWWGIAEMKVEYVLFSSTHQQLESKLVLSKAASTTETVVSGTDGKGLYNVYGFSYNLVEGQSYVVALRLTLTVAASSRISAINTNNPLFIDVDQISIRS